MSWLVPSLRNSTPLLILRVERSGRDTWNIILVAVLLYIVPQHPTFAYAAGDLRETV